jgi:hypothetical protein
LSQKRKNPRSLFFVSQENGRNSGVARFLKFQLPPPSTMQLQSFIAVAITVFSVASVCIEAKKVRPLNVRWFVPSLVRPGVQQTAFFVIEGPRWVDKMKDYEFQENYKITVQRPMSFLPDYKLQYPVNRKVIRQLQLANRADGKVMSEEEAVALIDKQGPVQPGYCTVDRISIAHFHKYWGKAWKALGTYIAAEWKFGFHLYKVIFNLPRFFSWSLVFSPMYAIRLNIRERGHMIGGYFHRPASRSPYIAVINKANSTYGSGRFMDNDLKKGLHFRN